ncbi:MAG: CinA family protein [Ruminococcaceae bacterium]|nr:CinA family protein [Oscillospiraceae bacterium]
MTKAEKLVSILSEKGWHISFAESCTGGLAAAGIVDVAGSSAVLNASFVTYANEAKIKYVDVSPETIKLHGVVSEEVAGEMAKGVAKETASEVGIGISGIAGPGGGTDRKPVGMVCFGFCIDGEVFTKTMQFGNIGRTEVRTASVEFVYDTLLEKLSSL